MAEASDGRRTSSRTSNAAKSAREQLTLIRSFEAGCGYDGGYYHPDYYRRSYYGCGDNCYVRHNYGDGYRDGGYDGEYDGEYDGGYDDWN